MALVPDLIREQARQAPASRAVCDGRHQLGYAELDTRATQVAWWLAAHGVAAETPVLLAAERGTEMLVGMLGTFRSGGVAVLADPGHPAFRLQRIIDRSRPAAVLTLARLGLPLDYHGVPVLELDAHWAVVQAQPTGDPGRPLHPDQLAYLVHTSGSTGEPKRVGVPHRSLAHTVRTHRDGHRITRHDRTAWLAPPGSSASAGELWPYLCAGASVHAAPTEVAADESALRDWLVEREITTAFVSMPMAEKLFSLDWPEQTRLRLLTVGSDRVRRWPSPDLPFEVAVAYGSAEANGVTSCLVPYHDRLTSATAATDRTGPPPVGRPWPDVRVHLLTPALRPVAPGEIGEIYVAGPQLARAYVDQPRHTAERFLPALDGAPGARMYRTGDLGRWRQDGRLEHCGRVDFEVKIRGYRVDPAEVEATLLDCPGVREAVVVAADHPGGERALAAYLVADGVPEPGTLRDFLARRLPGPAVPASYQVLTRLPLTTNGKVDRRALPPPVAREVRADYAEPVDEVERQIAAIWTEVLGLSHIGRHDHFLALGGTSLSATRVVNRLARRFGVRVLVRDLLRHPTVGQLADRLRETAPAPARYRGAGAVRTPRPGG
jgi:amino acid adenylation domain-containing protein